MQRAGHGPWGQTARFDVAIPHRAPVTLLIHTGVRVTTEMLPTTLDRCRARKSDAEVACLLTANAISGAAHMDMWRACRPGAGDRDVTPSPVYKHHHAGLYKYQLEAVFSCCPAQSCRTHLSLNAYFVMLLCVLTPQRRPVRVPAGRGVCLLLPRPWLPRARLPNHCGQRP